MNRRGIVGWLAACTASLACGACEVLDPPRELPVPHYLADDTALREVKRIMVLPFRVQDGVQTDAWPVRNAMLRELSKVQRFEVVPLPERAPEHGPIHEALVRGRLDTSSLAELAARYRIDGVVLGTITAERPYTPPHLGLRTSLVSLHDGEMLWKVDSVFDAADARVVEDCRHYAASFQAEEASMHGYEMNLLSPTRFASYVAHRVAGTLR